MENSITNKEEEEQMPQGSSNVSGSNGKKKAEASSMSSCSSPSTSHGHHDGDASPPPPAVLPPHAHLCSLPDIAHDAIASYLFIKDMHCMMESCPCLLKAYGGKVKDLLLSSSFGSTQGRTQLVLSLLSRRPGLTRVAFYLDETMGVVVEAMRKGYLNKLQELDILSHGWNKNKVELIQALCDALADGLCPKINALTGFYDGDLVRPLGAALRSRMDKGYCGLKSLAIKEDTYLVSPLLSAGACEALEELRMRLGPSYKAEEELAEWLSRTKALHLRVLHLSPITTALCSPGVAPRLEVIQLNCIDAPSIALVSEAIGEGVWPHLRELRIPFSSNVIPSIPHLVEAIGMGARELVVLNFSPFCVGREGCMAVARMLRDGGCPRLEELDFRGSQMGDHAVVELARALEGGAPCNTTLRRLDLSRCEITSVGMKELMESMGRGALPYLECLNLGGNYCMEDEGVVALVGAMSAGALQHLQELSLGGVGMGRDGAVAFFQVFRDHKPCPHLKKLDLGSNEMGDVGVVHLAKVIEMGALQHLQELGLSNVHMGEEGFKSLVKAIVAQQPNPGCPRLEVLSVNTNGIGDGGVMYLAEAMKVQGAMQHLQGINLQNVGMRMEGARAFFQSLRDRRVCPALALLTGFDDRDLDLCRLRDQMNATRGRARQIMIEPLISNHGLSGLCSRQLAKTIMVRT